jgi:hypothetical protein
VFITVGSSEVRGRKSPWQETAAAKATNIIIIIIIIELIIFLGLASN